MSKDKIVGCHYDLDRVREKVKPRYRYYHDDKRWYLMHPMFRDCFGNVQFHVRASRPAICQTIEKGMDRPPHYKLIAE